MAENFPLNPTRADVAVAPNRVLRNTYALLALSLVPTVLGAIVGVQINFSFMRDSPFLGLMAFLAIAFGFFYAIEKNKNSSIGVAILLAFTFFMGLMLTGLIQKTLTFANGSTLIATAVGGTSLVFFGMATIAGTIKRDISHMGRFLMMGVLVLLAAIVANIFLQIPALTLAILVAIIAVCSALLVYDINRIITGGETNYITATLHIYLDVYNIFSSLLSLLGITNSD